MKVMLIIIIIAMACGLLSGVGCDGGAHHCTIVIMSRSRQRYVKSATAEIAAENTKVKCSVG